MSEPVIAGFVRSPFTLANKGSLKKTRPDDLAATVTKSLIEKTGIDPETIEDILVGCAFPEGEQGLNLARNIVFLADLPNKVAGATINRFCGSSMQAIHSAAGSIALGAGEAFVCVGVESMTRIPMPGFNPMLNPLLAEKGHAAYISMGETAENLAKKYNISADDQNFFAVESHKLSSQAQSNGRFDEEIIPIQTSNGIVNTDECIRPETNQETLKQLKPAFSQNGTVTAGTSSPLTDGAAAVLVASKKYCQDKGIKPMAKIKSIAVSGCSPEIMGIGPVHASKKALDRSALNLKDIDIIELNEAFASQALAVIKEMNINLSKINIDGGAIALGHPLGATGARITGKAAQIMCRENKKYALATQCIGGGQGISTILEAI